LTFPFVPSAQDHFFRLKRNEQTAPNGKLVMALCHLPFSPVGPPFRLFRPLRNPRFLLAPESVGNCPLRQRPKIVIPSGYLNWMDWRGGEGRGRGKGEGITKAQHKFNSCWVNGAVNWAHPLKPNEIGQKWKKTYSFGLHIPIIFPSIFFKYHTYVCSSI
jgi:hypothetical protein